MNHISYRKVNITGGFWSRRQALNAAVTARQVYDRFAETNRFDALNCAPQGYTPHVYWDSDVAKWIEGVAYILDKGEAPELYALARQAIDTVLRNQTPEGYFNSHFQAVEPENRFTDRNQHELYCAGHWMEAAIAWQDATGESDFLDAMCRYADYIYQVFLMEQWPNFATPGHPELELALVRLWQATGKDAYRELAWFFLEKRGDNPKDQPVREWSNALYAQDQAPLSRQHSAEGHCVRAMYLYSAMADGAYHGQGQYKEACQAIFEDVLAHKLYITGGIGSNREGESFATPYYLPNDAAYTETCAAISLAMFAHRLQRLGLDSRCGDVIERVLYNGMLSGVGLEGRTFFYTNPLEIDPAFYEVNSATLTKRWRPVMQRPEVFRCSCCPPNVVRFLAALGDYFYSEDGSAVYVHQFADSEAELDGGHISQKTGYPADGSVALKLEGDKLLAVRIPGWCRSFQASAPYRLEKGYAFFEAREVRLTFDMPVTLYEADTRVQNNAGRAAVMRGPVVYCLEAVDNGAQLRSLRISADTEFTLEESGFGLPMLRCQGERKKNGQGLYRVWSEDYEDTTLKFIPYFGFANRGISEMLVWVAVK